MNQQEKKIITEEFDGKNDQDEGEPVQVVDKRRFINTEQAADAEAAATAEAARYPSYVEELQQRLKQSEEQVEKLQARFKQAQSELEQEAGELRARLQRNAEQRLEVAKGDIFRQLLDVADNLARAISSAEAGADSTTLIEGVKATYHLLLRQLDAEGVKPLVAEGERFDPALHEAVDTVAVEAERDGQVVAVYKAGYKYGDKLLRPAMVRVGRNA